MLEGLLLCTPAHDAGTVFQFLLGDVSRKSRNFVTPNRSNHPAKEAKRWLFSPDAVMCMQLLDIHPEAFKEKLARAS
jgi:hypothetical protein